jgi:hypothetical protein
MFQVGVPAKIKLPGTSVGLRRKHLSAMTIIFLPAKFILACALHHIIGSFTLSSLALYNIAA